MKIRQVEEKDYPEIADWFKKIKWPYPFVENVIPEIGLVAESEGTPLACAFLYTTGKPLAFIDWTATNPEVSQKLGMMALTEIIKHLQRACAQIEPKIRMLCHFVSNEKLAIYYEKECKFRKHNNSIQMVWLSDEKQQTAQT